ncbi:uncharacterized protein LOC141527059 [Cotesia typhae]|uniref:uncharacterized protein LOC141527059 n=1 Tax=Cotesia typhae TaxID=2053667 RepID=UPI003D69F433
MSSKKRSNDEYKNCSSSKKLRLNSANDSSQSKNNEDEKISFSTSENLRKIKKGDTLIEVVGYVDQIFPAREVSGNKNVFKFIINNADGIRIRINVWDKEIHRIEPLIILNEIIHIDGCRAKEGNDYTKSQFKEYELVIENNTIVNNLGIFELEDQFDVSELKLVKISEISNYYENNKLPKFLVSY